MRRDPELIRELLILIEEHEGEELKLPDNMDRSIAGKHLKLMADAELIHNNSIWASNSPYYLSASLDNKGHDLLDSIREEKAWEKFKKTLAKNKVPLIAALLNKAIDFTIGSFN